jgi:hypothetical protein
MFTKLQISNVLPIVDTQTTSKFVLFITSCDYGQANVMLSVASELVKSTPLSIHLASTSSLVLRVAKLSPDITFHLLPGTSMVESFLAAGHGIKI